MAKTPEVKVKDKIKKLLRSHGCYYAMPVMNGMATNGTPDFLVCVAGWFVGIEAKSGRNQPTDLQRIRLDEIRTSGGVSLVIRESNIHRLEGIIIKLKQIRNNYGRVDIPQGVGLIADTNTATGADN